MGERRYKPPYRPDGLIELGGCAIRYDANDDLYGQLEYREVDVFKKPADGWRGAQLGTLVDGDFICGKKGWTKTASEQELAFYILNNVRGANKNTPCAVGRAKGETCKYAAIRTGGSEYRCFEGVLYEKDIAEIMKREGLLYEKKT